MFATILTFVFYWMVLFVVCYMVIEIAQDQLYDEVTPNTFVKVTVGSLIFAALLTWLHTSFDTMLTSDIAWTVLQAIIWFAVFTVLFQFQPQHAVAIATITFLLVAPMASMGVDSLTRPRTAIEAVRAKPTAKAVRKSLAPVAPPPKAEATSKTEPTKTEPPKVATPTKAAGAPVLPRPEAPATKK
jgi:hypothetical protein